MGKAVRHLDYDERAMTERGRRWIRLASLTVVSGAVAALALLTAADAAGIVGSPGFGLAQAGLTLALLAAAAAGAWWYLRAGGHGGRLAALGLLPGLVLTAGVVAVVIAAEDQRGTDFAYNRTVGPDVIDWRVLEQAGWRGVDLCRCAPDAERQIEMPGGFETVGSFYLPDGARRSDRAPGVLLVHGNVWNGRDASTYRLWAERLADGGYAVLLFDMLGFGDSDDPYGRGPEGLAHVRDRPGQVRAALSALLDHPAVDTTDVSIMGHSGGVAPAVAVGVSDPRVDRIVAYVSPPPPGTVDPDDGGRSRDLYFTVRAGVQYSFIYGRETPQWVLAERYSESAEEESEAARAEASDPVERLAEPGHPPYLLILGERDEPEGHDFERERFRRAAEPKTLFVVPDADHYLNTAQSLGLVFYDRAVADTFASGLLGWLEASAP